MLFSLILYFLSHGSMGDTEFTVCLFFFVCTVADFSAADKDRGVKFCVRV